MRELGGCYPHHLNKRAVEEEILVNPGKFRRGIPDGIQYCAGGVVREDVGGKSGNSLELLPCEHVQPVPVSYPRRNNRDDVAGRDVGP